MFLNDFLIPVAILSTSIFVVAIFFMRMNHKKIKEMGGGLVNSLEGVSSVSKQTNSMLKKTGDKVDEIHDMSSEISSAVKNIQYVTKSMNKTTGVGLSLSSVYESLNKMEYKKIDLSDDKIYIPVNLRVDESDESKDILIIHTLTVDEAEGILAIESIGFFIDEPSDGLYRKILAINGKLVNSPFGIRTIRGNETVFAQNYLMFPDKCLNDDMLLEGLECLEFAFPYLVDEMSEHGFSLEGISAGRLSSE